MLSICLVKHTQERIIMKDVIAPLANAAGRVAANDGGRCLRINRTADAR